MDAPQGFGLFFMIGGTGFVVSAVQLGFRRTTCSAGRGGWAAL